MNILSKDTSKLIDELNRIVKLLPEHTAALETLYHLHIKEESRNDAEDILVRLNKIAQNKNDKSLTSKVSKFIKEFGPEENSPLKQDTSSNDSLAIQQPLEEESKQPFNQSPLIKDLGLAWKLVNLEQIDIESYKRMANTLFNQSVNQKDLSSSSLKILSEDFTEDKDKLLSAIILDSNTPYISLNIFNIDDEHLQLLDEEYMRKNHCLVFNKLEQEHLVVLTNPYDEDLKQDIAKKLKGDCHFYITSPAEFNEKFQS